VPVPRPRPEISARDAFLYLVMFVSLYASAYQLGSLLFNLIELAFPEGLAPYVVDSARGAIRWATASLIVTFPVFLFTATRIAKEIAAEPARRNSAIRKWLTYLTLFVATTVIVGDSISLVYSLLRGDLTIRFVLKTLVVAAIAGSAFGYFLWSSRSDDEALGR